MEDHEYITIIGDSMEDVQRQARTQVLTENRFSLMHRIVRQRLIDSRDAAEQSVVVATYIRVI